MTTKHTNNLAKTVSNTVYNRRLKKKQCNTLERDFEVIKGVSENVVISIGRKSKESGEKVAVGFDAVQMVVQPLFADSFPLPVEILDDGLIKIHIGKSLNDKMTFSYAPYAIWVFANGKRKMFMQGKIIIKKGAHFAKLE